MEGINAVTIRRMQLADIPQVAEIDKSSFSLPWPERSFKYELTENKGSRQWVAEVEENGVPRLVGMIVCWLILDELHVGTIAVVPEYRRQKIGQKLMLQAFREIKKEGAVSAFLEVRRSNQSARALYAKLGFIEEGVRKHYYKDNHEDAILMTLYQLQSFDESKFQE